MFKYFFKNQVTTRNRGKDKTFLISSYLDCLWLLAGTYNHANSQLLTKDRIVVPGVARMFAQVERLVIKIGRGTVCANIDKRAFVYYWQDPLHEARRWVNSRKAWLTSGAAFSSHPIFSRSQKFSWLMDRTCKAFFFHAFSTNILLKIFISEKASSTDFLVRTDQI